MASHLSSALSRFSLQRPIFSSKQTANVKPVVVQVRSSLENESGSPGVSDHSLEPIDKKVKVHSGSRVVRVLDCEYGPKIVVLGLSQA